MQGSDHDIFILRSSSSASSLSYSRADVLLAAVEMRLLDGPFPLPSSGHDSLCMIDSDTIIMTDSQLGNHLVENSQRTRPRHQSKHVSQLCARGTSNGLCDSNQFRHRSHRSLPWGTSVPFPFCWIRVASLNRTARAWRRKSRQKMGLFQ